MISIFTKEISPRLKYVCDFMFEQYFGLTYSFTTEVNDLEFSNIISYTNETLSNKHIQIKPSGLLFQTGIESLAPKVSQYREFQILFPTASGDLPFDIFSAVFYLLSRYEEYLPFAPDQYGRYPHHESVAYRHNFLQLPLIDIWLVEFKAILQNKFPSLKFADHYFKFIPTYDIDIAYAYRKKGWLINLGGFLRSPSWQRIRVLAGNVKDPYDCYDWLNGLHQKFNVDPIYFFLLAQKRGLYDKNIPPAKSKDLIKEHAAKYSIGIHPSWQSFLNLNAVVEELNLLERYADSAVTQSRQHYIRLSLPRSYQLLLQAGITDDYSMGYGTTNGFRASTANTFFWFDLESNEATSLLVHPFCFMDATSIFIDKKDAAAAFTELSELYNLCKKYEAPCVVIFHNNLLGTAGEGKGYWEMYEGFLEEYSDLKK